MIFLNRRNLECADVPCGPCPCGSGPCPCACNVALLRNAALPLPLPHAAGGALPASVPAPVVVAVADWLEPVSGPCNRGVPDAVAALNRAMVSDNRGTVQVLAWGSLPKSVQEAILIQCEEKNTDD